MTWGSCNDKWREPERNSMKEGHVLVIVVWVIMTVIFLLGHKLIEGIDRVNYEESQKHEVEAVVGTRPAVERTQQGNASHKDLLNDKASR